MLQSPASGWFPLQVLRFPFALACSGSNYPHGFSGARFPWIRSWQVPALIQSRTLFAMRYLLPSGFAKGSDTPFQKRASVPLLHFELDFKGSNDIDLLPNQSRLLSTMLRKNDCLSAMPSSSFSGSLPRPPRSGYEDHIRGPCLTGVHSRNTQRVNHRSKTTVVSHPFHALPPGAC